MDNAVMSTMISLHREVEISYPNDWIYNIILSFNLPVSINGKMSVIVSFTVDVTLIITLVGTITAHLLSQRFQLVYLRCS